jgi:hypothetical protein
LQAHQKLDAISRTHLYKQTTGQTQKLVRSIYRRP